jgi:Glycosyl hydrolase family 65, N-terminal domain
VIEATVAGVTAARCGGFGLAAAIDRAGRRRDLERAGADFVFGDVAELDLGISESDPWLLVFEGFDLAHETHREALPTLGNGYVATRGAMAWRVDDGVQLPGTYLAGVYNRLTSRVAVRGTADRPAAPAGWPQSGCGCRAASSAS